MQRQAQPQRGGIAGGQQQPVAPEIIKPHPRTSDAFEHRAEAALGQQLAWKDVVALQSCIEIRRITPVHRAKRQRDYIRATMPEWGGANCGVPDWRLQEACDAGDGCQFPDSSQHKRLPLGRERHSRPKAGIWGQGGMAGGAFRGNGQRGCRSALAVIKRPANRICFLIT